MDRKKTIIVFVISLILVLQVVPLTGAKPDFKGYMDDDYGTHEALVNLLDEKDNKTGALDIETQDILNKTRDMTEKLELDGDIVIEIEDDIANAWNQVEVNTELENVEIKNISKIEHLKPHIFDVVEGNETVDSWWDTLIGVFTEGFYKFYVKYTDEDGVHERVMNFSLVDSLFGLITEGVTWKTIDLEPPYNDNQFFNDWDIRARIYPDLTADNVKLVYGETEAEFSDVIANPTYYILQLTFYLAGNIGDDFEYPYIEINGGAMFEIQERDDGREIPGKLEISALRGIGIDSSRYIWLLESEFPQGEIPDEYTFYITVESIKIDLIGGGWDDIENGIQTLIGIITGGGSANDANITSFNPPYKIGYNLQDDMNIQDSSIHGLTLMGGYVKVEEQDDGSHEVVDRVWIRAYISPVKGGTHEFVPQNGLLSISTKEENGTTGPETVYDAVQWDAAFESQVNVTYSEEEENRTYIFANFSNMPSYFRIQLINKSTEQETLSKLYYETSDEIDFASYESYIYRRHEKDPGVWYCNESHIALYNIPTNFTLTGTFKLDSSEDRFTTYDNPNVDLIGRLMDNIMLRLASKLYAVGMTLRGIPSSVMNIASEGGWFRLRFQDNTTSKDDYLGMLEFWHSSDKYLWIEDTGEDFIGLYNETRWSEDSPRSKNEVVEIPISGRISGVGELYYESFDKNTSIEICTGAHDSSHNNFEKPLRFFYREPHEYHNNEYQKENEIYDFAEVRISDIPTEFRLNITEEDIRYYSTDSIDVSYTSLIRRDKYSEQHIWDYMNFHISEIPTFLRFSRKDGAFELNTTPSDEDGKILDDLKIELEDTHKYFNFEFLITNDVSIENHTVTYYPLDGNYISLYQDKIDILGEDDINTMSGRVKKLKNINYENETADGKVHFIIEKVKNSDVLKIAVRNDTVREHYDAIDKLEAFAIVNPMPARIEVNAERSKNEVVETPEVTNVSSIADIVKLIHAIEDMGQSIVDMVSNLTTGVIGGLGEFQSNASFDFDFDQNMDVTIALKKGDMDQLSEDTRWIHGVSIRQKTVQVVGEDGIIIDVKIHLEGLPTKGEINMNNTEDWTSAKIFLENYYPIKNHNEDKYLLIDIKGIKERDILVYFDLSDINYAIDIEANIDMFSDESENRVGGIAGFNISKSEGDRDVTLGTVYIYLKDYSDNPYFAEAYLPSTPASFYSNFDTGDNLSINYESNAPIDYIIANIGIGDENEVKKIEKDTHWTHGASIVQKEIGNETITAAKIYLTGLPDSIILELNRIEDSANISLEIDNWNPVYDWILLEAKGIDNKNDIIIFQNELRAPMDLKIDLDVEFDMSGPKEKVNCTIDIKNDKELGSTYLKVKNYENKEEPMIIEALLPLIPSSFFADISIAESIKIKTKTDSMHELEYVWIRIEKRVQNEWHDLTVILHKLPKEFYVSVEPNPERDFSEPLFIQGYPNIKIRTYDAMHFVDLNLDMDGRVMGNRGFTKIHAEHIPDETELFQNGDIYSIRSPQEIDFVLLKMGDLPIQKEYYLESIEIYSEELKSVDIKAKMVFGCYPIFELSECDANMLQIKMQHELTIFGRTFDLKAALIDLRIKESGVSTPMIAPLTINGLTTKMDSKHYLIPEPVTTVSVTLIG